MTKLELDGLTYEVIGCAIEVHKQLGPGLLEAVYERCFVRELEVSGIEFQTQVSLPVLYKGDVLDASLRIDVLVENKLVVELKAIDDLRAVHTAQILTYMKLLQKPKGVLINFNCTNIMREGQKTLVNEYYKLLPDE